MTNKYNPQSCYIIGESSLLIQCATQLLEQGYDIFGIVSSDQSVIEWAKNKDIAFRLPTDNIIDFFQQHTFSYLFSIGNLSVLPKEIISLPSKYAINYHDALLPQYAGLNATSWAIMNQEKQHGITWHIMTEKVDDGEILKQVAIEVSEGETAFTLNGKCYEAALTTFTAMIDELRHDKATLTPQDKSKRSYFSRTRQSSQGCMISWQRDAHEIDALVRGLDFGPYTNPLGAAKFIINNQTIIVKQTLITETKSTTPAGTITAINETTINVATTTYDLQLQQLVTLAGQPLSIADFVTQFKLQMGHQLEDISSDRIKEISSFDAKMAKHEGFWVEQLATQQPLVIPYINYSHPNRTTTTFETTDIPIPNDKIATLLTTTQTKWQTNDFILAAFIAYLAKISENATFDIGIRGTKAKHPITDFTTLFASHIPCRIEIDKENSFETLFPLVQKQVAAAKRRKTYLHDVAMRYPALAQLDNEALSIIIENVTDINEEIQQGRDLTFILQEEGTACRFSYNPISLTQKAVANIADQFAVFLNNLVEQYNKPIAQLSLLSEDAYQQILVDWNKTDTDYPNESCLHELFEQQVEKTPDAIAVIFEGQQLTYRELNNKANQVAHYLKNLGVGPENLVGLCLDRSLDMLIGLYGILKAGGAYLPLDPTYPMDRISFMLEDAGVNVVVTEQKWQDKLTDMTSASLLCLDSQWDDIAQHSKDNLVNDANANNLIYIIYTSGSTGRPKGVQITHQAFINFLYAMRYSVGLVEQDKLLAVTTLSFDIAGLELHLPLITGAQVILVSRATALDGLELLNVLTTSQATVMQATPATWQMLVNVGWQAMPDLKILSGGEALSRSLAAQLLARGHSVWNLYGPTETTVWSSVYQVKPQENTSEDKNTAELIGRPLINTQLYILDHYLQPTPIGIPGELHIGGDGLARGYLNRSELTNEKFIPNPLSDDPHSLIYKTGDLVRYRPDGNIEYISRIDHQVKIRGFRIEIGEIESILRKHDAVREAVVVAQDYPPGSKNLIGYVVFKDNQAVSSEQLLDHLRTMLPDYMVPALLMILDAMPLTPNGKVDRRSLPLPEVEDNSLNQKQLVIEPNASTEQKLTAIWCHLLGREQIDNDEKFFEIGGNSLLATEVILHIRDTFSIQLPVSKLFESSTIAKLTGVIDDNTKQTTQAEHIETEDDDDLLAMLQGLADNELDLDDVAKNLNSAA